MAKFTVNFDIRFYNGTVEVEADSPEEAKEKAERLPLDDLLEASPEMTVTVEDIFDEQDNRVGGE